METASSRQHVLWQTNQIIILCCSVDLYKGSKHRMIGIVLKQLIMVFVPA